MCVRTHLGAQATLEHQHTHEVGHKQLLDTIVTAVCVSEQTTQNICGQVEESGLCVGVGVCTHIVVGVFVHSVQLIFVENITTLRSYGNYYLHQPAHTHTICYTIIVNPHAQHQQTHTLTHTHTH
jgi:hypothetical protein